MSKNETVKDVRVLVSFYAAREDDKIHLALLDIFLWKTQKSENLKGGTIPLSYLHSDPNLLQSFVTLKEINKVHLSIMGNVKYGLQNELPIDRNWAAFWAVFDWWTAYQGDPLPLNDANLP